jgi:hypothetical protein
MFRKFKEKINFFFWKIKPERTRIITLAHITQKPFINIAVGFDDKRIAETFLFENNNIELHERALIIDRKLWIEPSLSLAIKGFNRIIEQSCYFIRLRPSLGLWLRFKMGILICHRSFYPEAVLFDGNVGSNYFHFFTDIINKIWLLDNYGINKNIPLIIGESSFNSRHFQFLYQNSVLRSYNWQVQKSRDFFRVQKLTILCPMPYEPLLWRQTISLFEGFRSREEPQKKVFLNRAPKNGRYISNWSEIGKIFKEMNFEIIDTNEWEIKDQIKLFSETKYLVCVHGAGETNIMYTDKIFCF